MRIEQSRREGEEVLIYSRVACSSYSGFTRLFVHFFCCSNCSICIIFSASFEIMRKEQQKTLQEKPIAGGVLNLCEGLVDNREEKGLLVRNNEMEVSDVPSVLSNDLQKSSFASHAPASRLPAPPGFKTNPLEKKIAIKSLVHPSPSEVHYFRFISLSCRI